MGRIAHSLDLCERSGNRVLCLGILRRDGSCEFGACRRGMLGRRLQEAFDRIRAFGGLIDGCTAVEIGDLCVRFREYVGCGGR